MLKELRELLSERESSETVYNHYRNNYILNNLEIYLYYIFQNNPEILLLGEAPGYRGCKLTGIPFTSENIIKTSKHKMFEDIRDKIIIHNDNYVSEVTATILWRFLEENNKPVPILWNAFPFHPHKKKIPESNRKPDKTEIEEGKKYLRIIYELFKPKKLCSLGKIGESVLHELFPNEEIIYIRHPSYGGKKNFINGMSKIF